MATIDGYTAGKDPHRKWSISTGTGKHRRQLSTLGALAGCLAREVCNPLTAMRAHAAAIEAELARADAAEPDVARRRLDALQDEIARLAKLVEAFLAYARPLQGKPERIQVTSFLSDTIAFARREGEANGHRVSLKISRRSESSAVFMDRSQLQQVLLNLMRHAATEGGGRLTVEIRGYGDQCVGIAVEHTGCGIMRACSGDDFASFFLTWPNASGLGVAIARRIVEAAGGHIRIQSRADGGTRFVVVLPTTDEKDAAGEPVPCHPKAGPS